MRKNILLTTFPESTTKNVGDSLITDTFVKLIQRSDPEFSFQELFRGKSLDSVPGKLNVFAPGMSVRDGTWPKIYRLYDEIDRLDSFFPIGCSIQSGLWGESVFDVYRFSRETAEFLRYIVGRFGPIPCRDQMIVDLLRRSGFDAEYSGDLALFDPKYSGVEFVPPSQISSVVFSVGHRAKYDKQSVGVLSYMADAFPDAVKYFSMHNIPDESVLILKQAAEHMGFVPISLAGRSANMDFYDGVDLHIGYRLHGHIAFIKRRKPSVLLVEDMRSLGFSRTAGTSVGCIDASDGVSGRARPCVKDELDQYLTNCFRSMFEGYQGVFEFLDSHYVDYVLPKIDSFVRRAL